VAHGGPDIEVVDRRYSGGAFLAPGERGYLHLAAQVRAPSHPGPIFRTPRAHAALLARLRELAGAVARLPGVEGASVFDAVLIAPPGEYDGTWGADVKPPHFDVVVLIRTSSPAAARAVQGTPAYAALAGALAAAARKVHAVVAREARRLADVEPRAEGLYAFHYCVAADRDVLVRFWEYLTRFYELDSGLDNAALLVPVEGERSDYLAIDHARWDVGLWRFVWRQARNTRAWTTLRRTMHRNHVGAMLILYRLA
jgi:hypothetical protein